MQFTFFHRGDKKKAIGANLSGGEKLSGLPVWQGPWRDTAGLPQV